MKKPAPYDPAWESLIREHEKILDQIIADRKSENEIFRDAVPIDEIWKNRR